MVKYQPTLAPGVDRWTWFVFIRTFRCWRNPPWHIFFDLIFHLCWNPTAITIVRINYLSLSMSQSEWNKHSVIRGDHIYVTVTPCLRMKDNLLMPGRLKSEVCVPSDKYLQIPGTNKNTNISTKYLQILYTKENTNRRTN